MSPKSPGSSSSTRCPGCTPSTARPSQTPVSRPTKSTRLVSKDWLVACIEAQDSVPIDDYLIDLPPHHSEVKNRSKKGKHSKKPETVKYT